MTPLSSLPSDFSASSYVPVMAANPRAAHTLAPLRATLLGTGSAVPPRVVENRYFVDELQLDTTAEWIATRTGIHRRHWARPGLRTSDLAVEAAAAALQSAGVSAEELRLVIVATSTPDYTMPSTACLVQQRLGAEHALAFDLQNACAGFVYALDVAVRYLQTGLGPALVIGADLGSRLINRIDRSTSIFFGDGAGAVVVGGNGEGRILASELHAQGASEPLSVPVGGTMTMDGRAIWDFATDVLPATIRSLCRTAGIGIDQLALLVPHQANRNILRASAEKVGLPLDRVAINIQHYGNTLAASIPLALDEAIRTRLVSAGDHIQLVGFGAGLAWGGVHWKL